MGYWGFGPWQNDTALDYRADLAKATTLTPLRERMQGYLRLSERYAWDMHEFVYAFAAAAAVRTLWERDFGASQPPYLETLRRLIRPALGEQLRALAELYERVESRLDDPQVLRALQGAAEEALAELSSWRELIEETLPARALERLYALDGLEALERHLEYELAAHQAGTLMLSLSRHALEAGADDVDALNERELASAAASVCDELEVMAARLEEPLTLELLAEALAVTGRLLSFAPVFRERAPTQAEELIRELEPLHARLERHHGAARRGQAVGPPARV